jgi:hypothetical protein
MPTILDYQNGHWQPRMIDDTKPSLNAYEIQSRLYEYAAEYSKEKWPSEHRDHLGISIIGDDCSRKIWYGFRWVKLIQHDPRIRRLFQRGHREEKQFQAFLLWAGFSFRSVDGSEQSRISGVGGHYGGSTDDICLIRWCDDLPIICEYKTHGDKSFADLKEKGLRKSKPQHYKQMSGYGKGFQIKHGLYCAVNKNTDEWYFEFVELDWNLGAELEKKANDIIYSKVPPQKINENPSYWVCKFCDYKDICHHNEVIEKNCRSCEFASPIANGKWHCEKFKDIIPKTFIPDGCDQYKGIV